MAEILSGHFTQLTRFLSKMDDSKRSQGPEKGVHMGWWGRFCLALAFGNWETRSNFQQLQDICTWKQVRSLSWTLLFSCYTCNFTHYYYFEGAAILVKHCSVSKERNGDWTQSSGAESTGVWQAHLSVASYSRSLIRSKWSSKSPKPAALPSTWQGPDFVNGKWSHPQKGQKWRGALVGGQASFHTKAFFYILKNWMCGRAGKGHPRKYYHQPWILMFKVLMKRYRHVFQVTLLFVFENFKQSH